MNKSITTTNLGTPVNSYFRTVPSMFDEIFDAVDYVFNPGASGFTSGYTTTDPYYVDFFTLDSLWDKYKTLPQLDQPNALKGFGYAKEIYQNGLPNFPASDIYLNNEKETLNFELALPGYSLDDLSIDFEDDFMIIEVAKDNAVKRDKKTEDKRVYLKQGLKTSSIKYKVPVPVMKFEVTKAKAEYHNGMLKVEIPRAEAYKAHKVAIKLIDTEK